MFNRSVLCGGLVVLLDAGCTGTTDDGFPPAETFAGATTSSEPDEWSEDEDEGVADDSTGPTPDAEPEGDSTGSWESTGGGQAGEAGGDTSTTAEESSTGDEPFVPGNGQPDEGMYAHCFEPDVSSCSPFAPLCIMLDSLMEGVCSHAACVTPADCDPAPLDGTATPRCMAGVVPPGVDGSFCVLDCADGRTCPAGMQCTGPVSFGPGYPTQSFCI